MFQLGWVVGPFNFGNLISQKFDFFAALLGNTWELIDAIRKLFLDDSLILLYLLQTILTTLMIVSKHTPSHITALLSDVLEGWEEHYLWGLSVDFLQLLSVVRLKHIKPHCQRFTSSLELVVVVKR